MDFPIHKMMSSQGIPIYFQEFPDTFGPMHIEVCVFSGARDDAVLNVPGIHHWGEHVPFKGTVSFPLGTPQIDGILEELGGSTNAYTGREMTVYSAEAPHEHWQIAAKVVTELLARPLLRDEDIQSERAVILQEIHERLDNVGVRFDEYIRQTLWAGHSLSASILGTPESLNATNAESIKRMRLLTYGRNRIVICIAGAMKPNEVVSYLSEQLEHMPDNPISQRRRIPLREEHPDWKDGEPAMKISGFEATNVALSFPQCFFSDNEESERCYTIASRIIEGGGTSPLMRILREEKQLVYDASCVVLGDRRGGMFALTATTNKADINKVVEAFWSVLSDPELFSDTRWNKIHKSAEASLGMYLPSPKTSTREMLDDVADLGRVRTRVQRHEEYKNTSRKRVTDVLNSFTREHGRVITFVGKK